MNATIDITPIIEIVIGLIATVMTVLVIPWIKSKVSASKWDNLCAYAETFVKCAELTFKGTNLGKDKKKYVTEKLTELANQQGLKFSPEAIEAAIEAAVKSMHDNENKTIDDKTDTSK